MLLPGMLPEEAPRTPSRGAGVRKLGGMKVRVEPTKAPDVRAETTTSPSRATATGGGATSGPAAVDDEDTGEGAGDPIIGPQLERSNTSMARKGRLKTPTKQGDERLAAHVQERKMSDATKKLLLAGIVKNRFCTKLSSENLGAILETMRFFTFKTGDMVVKQGEAGHYFFVAEDGVLEVSVDDKVTNTLVAGNSFGAIALLYNCPRTATVMAKSETGIWGADGDIFRQVMQEQAKKRFAENRRFLDSIPLFDGLTPPQKERVAELAIVEEVFEPGARVISEGETTTSMYCVKKGELSVVVGGSVDAAGKLAGGKKSSTLRCGDIFGERAALYGEARTSSVVADVHCELICIGIAQLKEALGDDPATCLQRSYVLSVLRKLPVVSHLSPAQQRRLSEAMDVRSYGPNKPVEDGARLLIVLDGELSGKRGSSQEVLKRGDVVQDDALMQVEELRGCGAGAAGGSSSSTAAPPASAPAPPPAPPTPTSAPTSPSKKRGAPPSAAEREKASKPEAKAGGPAAAGGSAALVQLKSGAAGCRVASLTPDAMVKALQEVSVEGVSGGVAEEQVIDYVRKILLAKKVPVFRDLSEEQIDKLVGVLVLKRYMEGAKVFEQGEVGRAFYVVASGEVRVLIDGKMVRNLSRGACFGERAVLFDEARSATVEVSSTHAELWSVDQQEFRNVVTEAMRDELVKRIQLQDTSVTLKSLRHVRSIGAGSFGSVRLVEHRRTKLRYALKRVRKQAGQVPKEVERECQLLAELDHPFCLRLVKTFETKDSVYMLTELITGGQLFTQTNQKMGVLNRRQAQFYIASLVVILESLHERNIVYRDLKPENVMLDTQGYLKLVDFGLAKKLDEKSARTFSLVGTLYYLAPEVIRGNGYGIEVDVWSLGVLFYELVCGRLPFGDGMGCEHDILVAVLEEPLRFPGRYADHAGKKLIQGLLTKQPEHRTGASGWDEIKQNKFFKAGMTGDIFNHIIGRELEPPVIPIGEEFPSEESLEGKVSLSDADELGGEEDAVVARVLEVFRRVKTQGSGSLTKQQLAKVLRVLDAETFNDKAVERLWKAAGGQPEGKIELGDFLNWISGDDGEAFTRALADIHT